MATPVPTASSSENVPHRTMITTAVIGATLLQSLDQTIANVALPYMQGSFSASYDEITRVLTSTITAAAIMTAPIGWMATRFGRKPLYIGCIVGFTIASMRRGAVAGPDRRVPAAAGHVQCRAGAAVSGDPARYLPARAARLRHAIWGMGVMIGPIMGPTLGGYLTEHYDWRWVFYINLPFGMMATAGLLIFLPSVQGINRLRFDWLGFTVLSTGIGALQLFLDRGQDLDWFYSREILVEAVLAGLGTYLFVIPMLSAPQPLIRPALFRDFNFLIRNWS